MKKFSVSLKTIIVFVLLVVSCSSEDSGSNNNPSPTTGSDLSLNMTVTDTSPYFGDNIIFSIKIINAGPETATGVVVKDLLPSGYDYISDNGLTNEVYDEITGVWTVPALSSGTSSTLNITANVNETGSYTNVAEVIAADIDDPDSVPNNNNTAEDDQDSISTSPSEPSPVQVSTYVASLSAGDGLTIDGSENLYATNYFSDVMYKIDPDLTVSVFPGNHDGPAGMVVDDANAIYLARYNSADIIKLDINGNFLETVATGIAAPIALDFDSEGNLYTNNNVNSAITKIDAQGNTTIIPVAINNNSSLTIDDNDNIYVSDYDSGIIKKLDAITYEESTFVNLPLNNGSGIGFIIYSEGYFYATSIGDNTVLMIDMNGSSEIIAGIQGVSGNTDGSGDVATFIGPNAIVASEDGMTLYVSSGDRIRKITGFRDE